jgi:leader peptidase (prepilin peptidase)/N-methyltransferase
MIFLMRAYALITWPLTWGLVLLGACVGSFMNVCILRIPERTFFKNTRSVCPSCQKKIPFYFNIPVFGYLFLKGRAACCGAKLSIQYPLVELLMALVFPLIYLKFPFMGLDSDFFMLEVPTALRFLHAVTFISLMITMSVIDGKLMIIPDELSLGMLCMTPLVVWMHPDLDWISAGIGAALGGGVLYGVAWFYWLVRRQYGIGFGDVKLLAAIGGWLGWQSIFPTLFIGSIFGSIMALTYMIATRQFTWKAKIPFGPFLAAGAVAHLIWGTEIFMLLSGS